MAIRPPLLEAGDTVGIVTLGSPIERPVVEARTDVLQELGFHVVLGDYVYARDGFLAGSDRERAYDFMRMVAEDDIKMILPSRGGVGVAGILPYLDFSLIRRHPKIISGYSDITALLNPIYQFADVITFQSLMLIDFRMNTPPYNYDPFYEAVSTLQYPRQLENPPNMPLVSRVPGNITAPIVGGTLTTFAGLLGTPYEIDTNGKIVVLEDTHEPTNTVYRYLKQLAMAGAFDDCAGIVMGECTGCPVSYGESYEEVIEKYLVPLNKPLMTGLATAHGTFKAAVPIGAMANLNTDDNTFTIIEPTVSSV
ncbi:muramoyltetrapeptide carboxypeptidase [Alteribacillus persepolensis]|uniref:Muramoyltetrapeptide carboxypeptidase n=1 Tax=Alteribacillus persepolensis TaxID=568899 RepID=A0A1G8C2W3_9BACI|nr:LD-carboxypeptidase [Alteribacillus persepolensis]SDH39817.1 muramoyltetrapeptide carboxypeptidase [Alteribacillus persepolensis]